MRYLLVVMMLVSVFFLSPAPASFAGFSTCNPTMLNCLPDEVQWCSYDSDSFWDTISAYADGSLDSEDTTDVSCLSSSGCYIIADESDDSFQDCVEYDVDGTVDCNEYSCLDTDSDGSITWNSGDTEYCCDGTVNNACATVCD